MWHEGNRMVNSEKSSQIKLYKSTKPSVNKQNNGWGLKHEIKIIGCHLDPLSSPFYELFLWVSLEASLGG